MGVCVVLGMGVGVGVRVGVGVGVDVGYENEDGSKDSRLEKTDQASPPVQSRKIKGVEDVPAHQPPLHLDILHHDPEGELLLEALEPLKLAVPLVPICDDDERSES